MHRLIASKILFCLYTHIDIISDSETHFTQNELAISNTADVREGSQINGDTSEVDWSQSISHVSVVNPLVAFYDIHGRKRGVLFFCSVPETIRNYYYLHYMTNFTL
jgi:hypothetical protein